MNKYQILSIVFLLLAVICISASIASGEDAFHLFFIFPIITVNSLLSGLGALFIFLFFIFMFLGFASGYELVGWDEFQRESSSQSDKGNRPNQPQPARKRRIEGGGVVLIGPIPIVFGSNPKLTLLIVIVTFAIMVVAMMFFISM